MTEGLNSSTHDVASAAQRGYFAPFIPPTVLHPIAQALDALLPPIRAYEGRRKSFLKMIGRGVSWSTVRHWTSGRRKPPAWVRQTVAEHLRRKAAELNHIAELLER